MKLNKIFMAIAAMAVVGCSSDDLNVLAPEQQAAEDSRLVELDPNFVIAGVGVENTGTRTHWEWDDPVAKTALVNKFLPIYTSGATFANLLYDNVTPANSVADLTAQAVGLCWLGQNSGTDTDVYTNYQFYHYGWLNNGETEAKIECDKLTNGAFYDEITATAGTAGKEADPTKFTLPTPKCDAGLNYNSGVYKTDNKSIFGGEYIVYYPFDETFENAGTIPAKAQTLFGDPTATTPTYVPTTLTDPMLGKATFRYSTPVPIEGGAKASDFGLYNLSSLVQLRVVVPSATDGAHGKKIDQIVLYSKKEQLLKQVNLAADKIKAGKKGVELYSEKEGEKIGTKTIVANFGPTASLPVLDETTPVNAFITVLPTTVEDLEVLVHSSDMKKWTRVKKANTEFKPGEGKRLDITVTGDEFKSDFIAVDEASLTTALTEARATITDPTKTATIEVIGDITLKSTTYNINKAQDAQITIKGDAIIVPEDVTLNVKTNMVSDVQVLGKSCCDGTNGGILDIQGGTLNNVTMVPTGVKNPGAKYDDYNPLVTYSGAATIAACKTFDVQAGNVKVKKAVKHKGNIKIAEGAKLFVLGTETSDDGDLNFMGSTVVNDGTIEVKKGGKYDMTDSDGNATATDGQRMTNNGKFIHNVDAGVGTAVQKMHQNGVYRCKVDDQIKLDDAYLQWTASSVIEMVNDATDYNLVNACQHNGKYVDIEVNTTMGTEFTNPAISGGNGDSKEIQIGNLTVTAGSLTVNYVTGTGKRTLTVNGDMAVNANTSIKSSKKINVKQNLTVAGGWLYYKGKKANEDGLAVTGDITVSGNTFDAGDVDALNITCANFYLKAGGIAEFGNRTDGDTKNLTVTGTIANPTGCTFDVKKANQIPGSVLAWTTCSALTVGGTFTYARPRVE